MAAIEAVGEVLQSSTKATPIQRMTLLAALGLEEDVEACCDELVEEIAAASELADGAAGDSPKYVLCVDTFLARWKLFLTVKRYESTQQPNVEMVVGFTVFMFKTRQNRARMGRQGLGDSSAKVAERVLMQHVFPRMGYEGWVGLSRSAMKAKAFPYREAMKEMWTRLRRSHPEMKTIVGEAVRQGQVGCECAQGGARPDLRSHG